MNEIYFTLFGKTYLHCTSCKYYDIKTQRCKLFGCWCTKDDGCTPAQIKSEEKKVAEA